MAGQEDHLSDELLNRLIGPPQAAGSYTRAYFYWKKFNQVYSLFQKELAGRTGPIRILEAGCAAGNLIFYLDQAFGAGRSLEFRGIDLDPLNIHHCLLKKQKYGTGNFTFSEGNAECLQFPDDTFDIVLCTEVLEHLKEPRRAADEFFRVLKPGGAAIITTPNDTTLVTRPKRIAASLFKKAPVPALSAGENAAPAVVSSERRQAGYGHISVKGLGDWIGIFSGSGFTVETVKRGSLLVGTPGQDRQRILIAAALLLEVILDMLPFLRNLSEDAIFSARKP